MNPLQSLKGRIEAASRMAHDVEVGDGAIMTIIDPRSFDDGGLEWAMRYGADVEPIRYTVASLLASYDYLLCGYITTDEAIRRLRLMRRTRAALAKEHNHGE